MDMFATPESVASRVAVVLVNWNGWRECIECIDSVLAQSHPNFNIFIVDNDSRDLSVERITAWCAKPEAGPNWRRQEGVHRYTDLYPRKAVPHRLVDRVDPTRTLDDDACRVTVLRSGGNLGFGGGCNVGIRAAGLERFSYFWFLNADTVVDHRALVELIGRAQCPGMGIVGSTLLFYDRPNVVHALGGGRLNRLNGSGKHIGHELPLPSAPIDGSAVERELGWVCGASMLVSARYIREVGPMQEDYFLYYEDADWAMRGLDRFRLGFAPGSIVFHKSGANSSQLMPLYTAGFHYRSRLRFMNRFFPDRLAAAKRSLFLEMLRHLVRGRWPEVRLLGETLRWTPPYPCSIEK